MSEHAPLVYVIDDDQSVRESVAMLLGTLQIETRCFPDCQSFLKAGLEPDADALILDVRLPGLNGLEFHAQFANFLDGLPVIFVSGHGDIPLAVRAMQQGALDFLQKPFSEQSLIDRVYQAIQHSAKRRQRQQHLDEVGSRLASLTPREREVLRFMVKGLSSKSIALALDISSRTVEQHRAKVMEKMDVDSIAVLGKLLASHDP